MIRRILKCLKGDVNVDINMDVVGPFVNVSAVVGWEARLA